jgi:hypothetical protein
MKHVSTARLRLCGFGAALALATTACGGGGGTANTAPPDAAAQSVSPGTATLNWTSVSQNTNGTALTDLAGYKVYYGTSPNDLSAVAVLSDPSVTTYQATNLSTGTWYFAVAAYTTDGTEGLVSNVVAKTVE